MFLNKILIKDGGFSTQLRLHVNEDIDGHPLWSARFNSTHPNAVLQTHLDFLNAGANIILTNTYQASVDGYMKYLNLTEKQSVELIKKTVKLAQTAKEQYISETLHNSDSTDLPMIAASIGPYGAYLHDGSEYSGNYADQISMDIIRQYHIKRIDAILAVNIVDILAIETIPCQIEAETIVDLLCDKYPNIKFWISFQCKDGVSLVHGESFRDAAITIWNKLKNKNLLNNCLAIGSNCVNPKFVTSLFKTLNGDIPEDKRIPLVIYSNSGEIYDNENGWIGEENCIPLETYVNEWIQLGARIIGGCCRTYAKDINRISNYVKKNYPEKLI